MSDQVAAELARKIHALIAKAESTDNEHEASAFMSKARQLMEEHSIDEGQIRDAANPQYIIDIQAPYSANWYKLVAQAGAAYYGAQITFTRTGTRFMKIHIYGRRAGCVTAAAMIPYLWGQVVRTGNALRKGSTPSEKRKAIASVGNALASRIMVEAMARDGAVEELQEAHEFLHKSDPAVRTQSVKATTSREAIAAARDISIHLQATAQQQELVA